MKKPDSLQLRGAIEMLERALVHVGRGCPTKWNGHYVDPALTHADNLLTAALYGVQREFRLVNEAKLC